MIDHHTLERLAIELDDISEELASVAFRLENAALSVAVKSFNQAELQRTAQAFLCKPLSDNERQLIEKSYHITLPEEDLSRKQGLALAVASAEAKEPEEPLTDAETIIMALCDIIDQLVDHLAELDFENE